MKLILNNNEIIFKTTKNINEIKTFIEDLYKKDIMKLVNMFKGLEDCEIWSVFSVDIHENELAIFGDNGTITLEILELNKINNL